METVRAKMSLGDRWRALSQDRKISFVVIVLVAVAILYKVALIFAVQPPRTAVQDELRSWLAYVKQNPTDPAGYVGVGSSLQTEGQWSAALNYYQQALKVQPHNLGAEYAIAKWYEAKNNTSEALKYLLMVGNDSSSDQKYVAYFDAGAIYQEKHQYQQAINLYQQALASNDTMADIHVALAQCYEATHQPKLALKEYQNAYQFDTTDPLLKNKIAALSRQLGAGK